MADRITDALRGPAPPTPPTLPTPQLPQQGGSGYQPPDQGPFECDNCIHFDGQGRCDKPEVIADPQVQGNVEPEGCCNFFESAHSESQDQEHTEGAGEDEEPNEQGGD